MLRVPLEVMTENGSVSKFNIIQHYLWTTTAQEKLERLAVYAIQKNEASVFVFHELFAGLAARKLRKVLGSLGVLSSY